MVDFPTPDRPGVDDPGPGRRLGIDVGTVRIGTALSDRAASMATPLETIARKTRFRQADKADIARLVAIIKEYEIVEVIIGLPRNLKGQGSKSVLQTKEIAFRLRRRCPDVAIRYGDERLTTVVATQALRASGRSSRNSRDVIDQAAAVEILQSWLDGRKNYFARLDAQAATNSAGEAGTAYSAEFSVKREH
ncbi:MAG: Holliday junction resolvase RuvX [Corynebacterium sp.]|nr:Holliday junction resolvase RuvX [Corynebacterium sp.]